MPVITIRDADDPRVAPYVSIRERDLTGRGDHFIVEGRVTLSVLVERSRFPVESIFILERRLPALQEVLARLPGKVPVYTADQAVFDAVAGFHVHRGILACARRTQTGDLEQIAARPRLVAGFGLSNHDNVGALMRNAAGLGAGGMILDGESCDPLYRKAIRVSAGTSLWMPWWRGGNGLDLLETLKRAGHTVWALTPDPAAEILWNLPPPDRLTLLVGAEGPGLSRDVIEACQPVRIPMAGGVDSLNVATAAAIALAHVCARDAAGSCGRAETD